MTYVDAAILDAIEWLCRRVQVLTGRTNVWLALQLTNLSIVVYFIWTTVSFWQSDILPRVLLAVFCTGLLYALTQTVFKEPIEAYEQSAYRRVAKGLRNPRRVRDAVLRISFLGMSVMLLYPVLLVHRTIGQPMVLLGYSLVVLTTLVLYLLACDPLPPCEGKVREWRRGLVRRPAVGSELQRPPVQRALRRAGRGGMLHPGCILTSQSMSIMMSSCGPH